MKITAKISGSIPVGSHVPDATEVEQTLTMAFEVFGFTDVLVTEGSVVLESGDEITTK
jgi:hypothetical protein